MEVIEGTKDLLLDDVAHLMVPGRGRDSSGFSLNSDGVNRVATARELYQSIVAPKHGRIVCSGYKSPVDSMGLVWSRQTLRMRSFAASLKLTLCVTAW